VIPGSESRGGPPRAKSNHDSWVKMYILFKVIKTDISAVLSVKSDMDPFGDGSLDGLGG